MPTIGDIVKCKRCGKEFSLVVHKLAQIYCDDCKYVKDREYRRLYDKRKSHKIGRPKK